MCVYVCVSHSKLDSFLNLPSLGNQVNGYFYITLFGEIIHAFRTIFQRMVIIKMMENMVPSCHHNKTIMLYLTTALHPLNCYSLYTSQSNTDQISLPMLKYNNVSKLELRSWQIPTSKVMAFPQVQSSVIVSQSPLCFENYYSFSHHIVTTQGIPAYKYSQNRDTASKW